MNKQVPGMNQLIAATSIFSIIILLNSVVIVFTSFPFVRVITLISVIGGSLAVGAFIREMVLINKKS